MFGTKVFSGRAKYVFTVVAAVALLAGACSSRPRVTINTPPTAKLLAAPLVGPAPLFVDFSGLLSSDPGGEVVSYHWSLGDGTESSAPELSHTYTVEGHYTVTLTVTDNKGGIGTETVDVLVNTMPTVSAGADFTSGTTPFAVNFTSISDDPGGSIADVSWDFGDGGVSSLANPSHTYLAAGSYSASVTVTDNLGSTATDVVELTVSGNQGPVASISTDVTTGKTPLAVSFDGSASTDADDGIVSWDWDFGDGNSASGPIPAAHSYSSAGTYTAKLTVTDALGATDSTEVNISVADNVAPTANALITGSAPKSGFAVQFDGTASDDSDGTIVSWDWDFADGNLGSGVSPTHTYSSAGSYLARLTVTDDNGATASDLVRVDVTDNLAPVAGASVVSDPAKTGAAIQFGATGSSDPDGTISSYSWDFGDTGTGTGPNPTHVYAAAGVYNASLTVTDNNGATDIAAFIVTVVDNVAPTASFSSTPSSGAAPLPVAFNSAASSDADGSIVAYSWDFGDSTSSTAESPNHTYAAAGTYTAELTVTDDNGATGVTSTVITVS